MTYELSLEYGSYPVKVREGLLEQRTTPPAFLLGNQPLLDRLTLMNDLFHELFLTIECTFHYIGSQSPETIEQLRVLYTEVAEELTTTYPEEDIVIEYFIL